MGKITALSPQKKHKERVNIYIDGAFYSGADAFTVQKYRLKEGAEVSVNELNQILFESECASAFEKASNLLGVRQRAESEIRTHLADKNYAEAVIESTVEKLKGYRYIDDAEFCKAYTDAHFKTWGALKIRYALKNLGIAPDVIEAVFQDIPDQSGEAYRLAVKYIKNKHNIEERKIFNHLMQKGFSSEAVKKALGMLKETIAEETENESD